MTIGVALRKRPLPCLNSGKIEAGFAVYMFPILHFDGVELAVESVLRKSETVCTENLNPHVMEMKPTEPGRI